MLAISDDDFEGFDFVAWHAEEARRVERNRKAREARKRREAQLREMLGDDGMEVRRLLLVSQRALNKVIRLHADLTAEELNSWLNSMAGEIAMEDIAEMKESLDGSIPRR